MRTTTPILAGLLSLFAAISFARGAPVGESPAEEAAARAAATHETAWAYLQAILDRDLETAARHMSEDFHFIDPTADLWGMPLADGLRGRGQILELTKSWGISKAFVDVEREFACGDLACIAGTIGWDAPGKPPVREVPFVTVLRVEGDQVVERRDYGDWDSLAAAPPSQASRPPEEVAHAFLAAYSERRIDDMVALYAADALFVDETAAVIGHTDSHQGAPEIRRVLEESIAQLPDFSLEAEWELVSTRHAVFVGTVRLALPGEALGVERERVDFELPMILALSLSNGEIAEHRDWIDYVSFLEQVENAQSEAGGE